MALLFALLAAQVLGILLADGGWIGAAPARLVAALALLLGALLRRRSAAVVCCALVAIGAGSASRHAACLLGAMQRRPPAPFEVTIEGEVVSVARPLEDVEAELRKVVAAPEESARVPARVVVRALGSGGPTPLADALPGDRLRLRVRLRPPEARANPGRRDALRDLARRGIGAVGTLVHPALVVRLPEAESIRVLAPLHAFRARSARSLRTAGEGGALLATLALGERGGLATARSAEFRVLGLTHLLSVSGLHLAIAAAGAFALAVPIARRSVRLRDARRAALVLAALVASGYALLAGFEVPMQRSLAMLLALVAGVALRRPVRRAAPLLVAALAILAADPAALFDAGAQMSFLASAALVLARKATPPSPGLRGHVSGLLHASALATAATAPVAVALGGVSPWGLVANAIAVPWTGFVLMPLSFAAAAAAGFAHGAFAELLVRTASRVADLSLAALHAAASIVPGGFESQPAPVFRVLALGAAIALLAVRSLGVRCAGALGIAFALAALPPARIDPQVPRVVGLDVAQGDATLVQGRSGALLVDGGVAIPGRADLGASVVVPALRALGVDRLDLVAASHGDLDHRGGLVAVLAAIPVRRLWLPYGTRADPAFAPLVATAAARGVAIEERGAGAEPLRVGDLEIQSVWPPREPSGRVSRNDASLVLRVAVGTHSVLLTGDIEAEAEHALVASGAPLRADVLKLAHHGSRTSSTAELLAAVGGEVAIASAPRFGRFGMPHAEVVARVHGSGYALWWTGRDGAVLISLGDRLWARGWR